MATRHSARDRLPRDIARDLEERLRFDEGDDFSLLQAPSVVSSLEQLSTRDGGRPQGGESFVSPLGLRAASLPGSVRGGGAGDGFLDTPRGAASPQLAVFIHDDNIQDLCLGIIGSSGRFCIARKTRGANHCGTVAHIKNKFMATTDTYYPPAGSLLGRASAKKDPAILREDIPRGMLPIFEASAMTTNQWVAVFKEAIRKGPPAQRRAGRGQEEVARLEEVPDQQEEDEDEGGDSGSLGESSFISMVDVEPDLIVALPPVWNVPIEDADVTVALGAIILEQQEAIANLSRMIDRLNSAVPKVADKINEGLRPRIHANTRDMRGLRQSTEEFRSQVGALSQFIMNHGSLVQAVQGVMEDNEKTRPVLQGVEEQMETFAEELVDSAEQVEQVRESLLVLIDRVSAISTKKTDSLDARITSLEGGAPLLGRRSTLASQTASPVGLTPDTSFGHVLIGSSSVEVTMNTVLSQIRSLESHVQAVADQVKSTGVAFHSWTFSSETDFGAWYMANNPSGGGPSAFVDIVSIWSFASTESGTEEWLLGLHWSQAVGFKATPDTAYAHSMTTRYPRVFVGKVDTILSSQTIKMLESVEIWHGNGMGDGFKERLSSQLNNAIESHMRYCEDYVPDGPVRAAALKSAQATFVFFHTMVAYLDDELAMLTSFNLPPKQTLLLLSNQVVQICEDLFEFRNHPTSVDILNRVATAIRYGWVTLQSQGCMSAYLRDKFRKHPGINSTYMRFLTRNLADQSSIGLKTKLEALAAKVTKVESGLAGAATKAMVEKLDSKQELIIKANSLKRTLG
jgi:hypothetical protein